MIGRDGRGVVVGVGLVLLAACGGGSLEGGATETAGAADAGAESVQRSDAKDDGGTAPVAIASSDTAVEVALGRALFWDPVLSGNKDIACATCHHPARAYADGLARSVGTGGSVAARNALTILNVVSNGRTGPREPEPTEAPMFWDVRVRSLESQAREPLLAEDEMRGSAYTKDAILPEVVERVAALEGYRTLFAQAYGEGSVNEANLFRAIARFERTLVDTGSSFERFQQGDRGALGAREQRGLQIFTDSGCGRCHGGPMFSDYALHRLVDTNPARGPVRTQDEGAGRGAFRTPSLRNVTGTAPYMHDGALGTLDDVFAFYARVDRTADPALRGLRVPAGRDREDVVAFLAALSNGTFDRTVPEAVPSGLPPGGAVTSP